MIDSRRHTADVGECQSLPARSVQDTVDSFSVTYSLCFDDMLIAEGRAFTQDLLYLTSG